MNNVFHALVLGLHQPSGNLDALLDGNEWEAREILYALDRIPRSLWGYEDVGRVHLSLSGTLLETISHPDFQRRVHGIVKCGEWLWHVQNQNIIRILGTGYYHPVMPLTPPADWGEQLGRWRGLASHLFWRDYFPGFWPPEMGFCMEMIPHLKRMGYQYVIVDCEHVQPLEPMPWEELRYRPHIARFGEEEIVVIVRDRDLSNAQESGMEPGWFDHEVNERTKHCTFPPLVTTCTDGENGGWFRNVTPQGNFWGAFYKPLLDMARNGQTRIRPVFIEDYLKEHGACGRVAVRTGAWNTGWHSGDGFTQWTGSQAQRNALRRLAETSGAFHERRGRAEFRALGPELHARFEDARWRILRAQTSCNFYWGEAWLPRCHRDLDDAWNILNHFDH